jgi:hypothetical protein
MGFNGSRAEVLEAAEEHEFFLVTCFLEASNKLSAKSRRPASIRLLCGLLLLS